MGFIEKLNKYGHKITIQQTQIYKKIMDAKVPLEVMGLDVKIKNEFDLFEFEVIYKGMVIQNNIENAYEIFHNQNYDLLDYLNYEEKQKMFNNDLAVLLKDAPSFYDEVSQTQIYIPYLEPFMNKRYINDYQILLLKQHRDYIKNYKVTQKTAAEIYGSSLYRTHFTSLENVYEDERHLCMYYDELKSIYIFKKDTHELLNKVILLDHESSLEIDRDIVKEVAYNIENYLYKECLELLRDKEYIGERTYKKVIKKYR